MAANPETGQAYSCNEKRDKAIEVLDVQATPDAKWGEYSTKTFINSQKPHIYYFVTMDCDQQTHMTNRMMPKI